jgi:hypothetical protein
MEKTYGERLEDGFELIEGMTDDGHDEERGGFQVFTFIKEDEKETQKKAS